MSNLKLPEMSYKNLYRLAPENGDWKKVAYQTWIRRQGDSYNSYVEVKHHKTIIASMDENELTITNGGFNTPTTANRLNRIVRDNGITDRWVGIKQRTMYVLNSDRKPVEHLPASFIIN